MRTKNFFKSLAVAAVALVGVFATSCSEEDLNVTGNVTGSGVELSPAVATLVVNVVDLGDNGVAAKTIFTETREITSSIGSAITVECPEFDGYAEYTVAKSQSIKVPSIQAGQAIVIPVTFYVTKLTSAYKAVLDSYEIVSSAWENPRTYVEKPVDEPVKNESDYPKFIGYEYPMYEGIESYEEVVPARATATTDEEIILSVVEKMIGLKESEWPGYLPLDLAPWTQANITLIYEYGVSVEKFTYGETTKTFKFNSILGIEAEYTTEDIANHDHSHDHGHGNGNAGGGSAE